MLRSVAIRSVIAALPLFLASKALAEVKVSVS
jgi:hypothetical protein